MLTTEQLNKMEPNRIFATGLTLIEHPWFNQAKKTLVDGKYALVRWVAVRGNTKPDWVIYHSLNGVLESANYLDGFSHLEVPVDRIASYGSKLSDKKKAKFLLNASDAACDLYRED